jgi:hypothetical protein
MKTIPEWRDESIECKGVVCTQIPSCKRGTNDAPMLDGD